MMPSSPERSAKDLAVLSSTRATLEATRRQSGLAYADDVWSPIPDITLEIIARNMGAILSEDDLGSSTQELGLPAYFGAPVIVVNRGQPKGLRSLALRHGLAHLVAGELEPEQGAEIRFMSSAFDWMTLEERRADLFALADLVPDRELRRLVGEGYSTDELFRWMWCEIKRYTLEAWPTRRVHDRAVLRLALWCP
jgi:Zn-dependent peptidase ImmA (M78 family)